MSHFSVMVIGENPEAQLQPFHEFECTGTNDEYVQDIDITEDILELMTRADNPLSLESALGDYGLEDKTVEHDGDVCRDGAHKYGFAIVRGGELIRAIDRTNPNKRWDWYQLGGRFSGRLTLKSDGMKVDQARKSEIDFERMMADKEAEARQKYRHYKSLVADCDPAKTWLQCRESHPNDTETARHMYWHQPAVQRCANTQAFHPIGFDCVIAEFACTEEDYAQRARARAVTTFAVLMDSQWYQRGRMGWWGVVHDEQDESEWQRQCAKLLAEVSDDTLISIYDCHI